MERFLIFSKICVGLLSGIVAKWYQKKAQTILASEPTDSVPQNGVKISKFRCFYLENKEIQFEKLKQIFIQVNTSEKMKKCQD